MLPSRGHSRTGLSFANLLRFCAVAASKTEILATGHGAGGGPGECFMRRLGIGAKNGQMGLINERRLRRYGGVSS
ncbi:hypothetical protein BMJ22_03250 [Sinorhizobium medicae]|nr:hypothetical protein BMJ22_03250 [Sinorhizobium medicae]